MRWMKRKRESTRATAGARRLLCKIGVRPVDGPTPLQAIFSTHALRRAWLRVREASGGPGVDRVSIRHFEAQLGKHLARLQEELLAGHYRPQKVQRMLMPKPNGGWRPLAIWTLRDRIAQRTVHDFLQPRFERLFLDSSFGFRPGRGVDQAVQSICRARDANRHWVADADIRDCFGSIKRKRLMLMVRAEVPEPEVVALIELWLKAKVFNSRRGMPATANVTQGGVISPLLANLFLHQFDQRVCTQLPAGTLVRFADDFVILCRRRREADGALRLAAHELNRLGLELHPQKSQIIHFDQGFKFLGRFFLRGEVFVL